MDRSPVPDQRGGANTDAPYRPESARAGQSPPVQQDHENSVVANAATSPSGRAIPPETRQLTGLCTAYHKLQDLLAAPRPASDAGDNAAAINQRHDGYSSACQAQEYQP